MDIKDKMRETVNWDGLLSLFLVAALSKKKLNYSNMKKITIEITEEQYAKMNNHLQKKNCF